MTTTCYTSPREEDHSARSLSKLLNIPLKGNLYLSVWIVTGSRCPALGDALTEVAAEMTRAVSKSHFVEATAHGFLKSNAFLMFVMKSQKLKVHDNSNIS